MPADFNGDLSMNLNDFCVINASFPVDVHKELDEYVDYRQGLDSCFEGEKMLKKTISWHSLATAFSSEFFVYKKQGWEGCLKYDNVLVLVREDLAHVEPLIKKLKLMGKKVGVGFHENGENFFQFCQDLNYYLKFQDLCDKADYYWNINDTMEDFLQNSLSLHTKLFTMHHAYPTNWAQQFVVPFEKRKDVIIGSRTLGQFVKRNTLNALGVANSFACVENVYVTYLNCDNVENSVLQDFFDKARLSRIKLVKGPLEYHEWLKLIAKHKMLFHIDHSDTLGQVIGDSMMLGVRPGGGTTSFERNLGLSCEGSSPICAFDDLVKNDWKFKRVQEEFKIKTSYEYVRKAHEEFFKTLR